MPSPPELLGLLIVIIVIWLLVKVARLAFRLIFFFIAVAVIAGAVYWFFMR